MIGPVRRMLLLVILLLQLAVIGMIFAGGRESWWAQIPVSVTLILVLLSSQLRRQK